MLASRRGFTLIELMISITVLAILGAAALRTLTASARLNEKQEAGQRARAVARGSLARLASELRAVPIVAAGATDPMVTLATADSVEAFVPYAVALYCGRNGNTVHLSVLPRDTTFGRFAEHAAVLIRSGSGQLQRLATPAPAASGAPAVCTATAALRTLPGGAVVQLQDAGLATALAGARPGTAVHLARQVRYVFASVGAHLALFRSTYDAAGVQLARERIAEPFAPGVQLSYWSGTLMLVPPVAGSALRSITGLRVALTARTDEVVRAGAAPEAEYATSIFFQNAAE